MKRTKTICCVVSARHEHARPLPSLTPPPLLPSLIIIIIFMSKKISKRCTHGCHLLLKALSWVTAVQLLYPIYRLIEEEKKFPFNHKPPRPPCLRRTLLYSITDCPTWILFYFFFIIFDKPYWISYYGQYLYINIYDDDDDWSQYANKPLNYIFLLLLLMKINNHVQHNLKIKNPSAL